MKKITLCLLLCFLTLAFSLSATAQDTTEDWQKAVASGKESLTQGNVRLATFYFANALGKAPGNMEIISTYRDAILASVNGSSDDETRLNYLTALEVFLENQIAAVPTDKVEQIVTWLDEVQTQKNALQENQPQEETASETDENAVAFEELKSMLHKQEEAVEETLKLGKEHFDVASYQLQECVQLMRSIIALQPDLDKELKKRVAEEYDELQKLSDKVVDAKSAAIWSEYLVSYNTFVDEINKFKGYVATPAATRRTNPLMEPRRKESI